MEYRNSGSLSSNGSSVSANLEELPKKPPSSETPKLMFQPVPDVSDISQISEIISRDEPAPANCNFPRTLHSTTNFPQTQIQPSNSLADHTMEPKFQQIHQQAATIQHKTLSLDLSTFVELDKSSQLELSADVIQRVHTLWECLKKQDEKLNTLQAVLERKADPKGGSAFGGGEADPNMALVPSLEAQDPTKRVSSQKESPVTSPGNKHVSETNCVASFSQENSQLLSCLQSQTEQIQKLTEQNQKLLEQNMRLLEEKQKLQDSNLELKSKLLEEKQKLQDSNLELKSKLLFTSKRKSLEKSSEHRCQSLKENNCNTSQRSETTVKKSYSSPKPNSNAGYREASGVEKTSTSTMTSLIYDGSDKVVYQKLTTVTTESKKQCSEISVQCPPKNKDVRTPESRPSPKDHGSGSRKKIGKCRKCGKCSPRNTKSPHSNSLNASKGCKMTPDSGGKTGCGTLQTCEEEIQVNNVDSERMMVPRYENILRNVNELNLNCNEVETTPKLGPVLKPSSKERNKYVSPRHEDLSPRTENYPRSSRKKSCSSVSNSSTDSSSSSTCSIRELSPKKSDCDSKQESTAISIYGLSSPNLSKDTRRYLDNFGLTRDRPQFSKSRTTLVKRYLR